MPRKSNRFKQRTRVHRNTGKKLPFPSWIPLMLCGACLLCYGSGFGGEMVFDSRARLAENPVAQQFWPPRWLTYHQRPLAMFTFALNFLVGGDEAAGFRLVNTLIHAANACLLFGIVRRTLEHSPAPRLRQAAWGIALAASALWAVHPLATQSVSYVIQRMESLMGTCYLAAIYCLLRATEVAGAARNVAEPPVDGSGIEGDADGSEGDADGGGAGPGPRGESSRFPGATGWLTASALACWCGMAAKEVMVTAPVALLWFDYVFLARSWSALVRRRGGYYLGVFASWAGLAALMLTLARNYGGNVGSVAGLTASQYARSQPGVILHYLQLCFWPETLCLDYAWPVASGMAVVVPASVLAVLVLATVCVMVRWPRVGFLPGMFFLVLAPTSSIVPVVDLAFEHRMYLSLAALLVLVVIGVVQFAEGLSFPRRRDARVYRRLAVVVPLLIGSAFALRTYVRNRDYLSREVIWRATVRAAPHNARALRNLASILSDQGQPELAVREARAAIEACRGRGLASARQELLLGELLTRAGEFDQAVSQLSRVIADLQASDGLGGLPRRTLADAYASLGTAREGQGELAAAADAYQHALAMEAEVPLYHALAASVAYQQGQFERAAAQWESAAQLEPEWFEVRRDLVRLYLQQGEVAKAQPHLRSALQLQPRDPVLLAVQTQLARDPSGRGLLAPPQQVPPQQVPPQQVPPVDERPSGQGRGGPAASGRPGAGS